MPILDGNLPGSYLSLNDGEILSEFPMGTLTAPQTFPIRNRIFRAYAVPGNLTQRAFLGA